MGVEGLQRAQVELRRGYRDYLDAKAQHLRALEVYSFGQPSSAKGGAASSDQTRAFLLVELCGRHIAEQLRARKWRHKTETERREQYAIMQEILGAETDVSNLSKVGGRKVKDVSNV